MRGHNHRQYEVAVLGGGSWGLVAALAAMKLGLRTCLIDAYGLGHGASNGILGALMPHPSGENTPLTRAQLWSVLEYEQFLRSTCGLEADHALFSRPGRITPIFSEKLIDKESSRVQRLREFWSAIPSEWLPKIEDAANVRSASLLAGRPVAFFQEGVTGRVSPRELFRRLIDKVAAGGIDIYEHAGKTSLTYEGTRASLFLPDLKHTLVCDRVVLACGFQSGEYLPAQLQPHIHGLKGQALLCKAPWARDMPMVYQDGFFFVPHSQDDVLAIGSVSSKAWDTTEPDSTTAQALHEALMRVFRVDLEVQDLMSWSAIRPATSDGKPIIGPLPGQENIMIATGGYKIGLGLLPFVYRSVSAFLARHFDGLETAFLPQRFLHKD
jgi:glycine/D-amino acid oxidase-like deaminating enzyme